MGKEPAPMNADFAARIENGTVYVAICEHKFAGYVVCYSEGNHFHLESVAVLPEQSRRGIGTALIGYVERMARCKGVNAVELYTNEVMLENIAMYQKMGYEEISRKRQAEFNRVFFRKTW
jgi:ribosomal protein S18 acetylase RimI-like enzyme